VRSFACAFFILIYNNRYFLVQKAKDADTIGIVVGTLGVGKALTISG
jgi:diphthamide biosynthesis enzyme Dph1/Dph2-like protein